MSSRASYLCVCSPNPLFDQLFAVRSLSCDRCSHGLSEEDIDAIVRAQTEDMLRRHYPHHGKVYTKAWAPSAAFPNEEYEENKPLSEINSIGGVKLISLMEAQDIHFRDRASRGVAVLLVKPRLMTRVRRALGM